MSRIVYVNGHWQPEEKAQISVFDRGFLFADAVYEVTAVIQGKLAEFDNHMARLERSCKELELNCPWTKEQLREIHLTLIEKNQLHEGAIYIQMTRGNAGDRDFSYPDKQTPPTLVLFTQAKNIIDHPKAQHGVRLAICPDIRWRRRDIKTVGLLATCMAKAWALSQGADDALLVEEGLITEGTSFNVFIISQDNTVITRPLSNDILHGITRRALINLADNAQIKLIERTFTPDEARSAKEVFISSATAFVWPVVEIDGITIGNGQPGPITRQLREIYLAMLYKQIGCE